MPRNSRTPKTVKTVDPVAPVTIPGVTNQEAAKPVKPKQCRAENVGHLACDCGGPRCGGNVTF
jgi:hypothetical protein